MKQNSKRYWIVVDSWNLMESMATESLSPYSFYQQRRFGSNLSRKSYAGNEKINELVLSEKKPQAEYAIQITDSIIESQLLHKVGNGIYTYPKTIYFSKDEISVCFADTNLMKGFVAEANILFEVKCIDKYKNSFFVDPQFDFILKEESSDEISFDAPLYIEYDERVNVVKGGIIGYLRGLVTSTDFNQQHLLNMLNATKNEIAGLCTSLLMQEERFNFENYVEQICAAKSVWMGSMPVTNLFDIALQLLDEIRKTVDLRNNDILWKQSKEYNEYIVSLDRERRTLQESIERMEEQSGIAACKRELRLIKDLEVQRGRRRGKTREYFKKDTPEFLRKQQLKETVEAFEQYNSEYKVAKSKIKEIKNRIDEVAGEAGKYDGAIRSLLLQISDIFNNLISKVNSNNSNSNIDASAISYENGLTISGNIAAATSAEICMYDIVLQYVQNNSIPAGQKVSTNDILTLIEKSANTFKETSFAQTADGCTILNILRQYYAYKTGLSSDFEEPSDLPIMQAIMAFIIKAQGFDQIERFMLHRHYRHKELAFMLLGSYVGYAAMPKTFTNPIYQNDEATTACEKEEKRILEAVK